MHDQLERPGSRVEPGTLYVLATPLGNLDDLSPRARAVLGQVDTVAAEDTRVTGQLLSHLGLRAKLVALHAHNEAHSSDKILAALAGGASIALVSDAGTPAISDPGALLVAKAHAAGVPVCPIPGPSAVATALSVAGFAEVGFRFVGFLPSKGAARRQRLGELAFDPEILVIFEAPHRIVDTLTDMLAAWGPTREVVLCRELTKRFETIRRMPITDLQRFVAEDPQQQRGEIVLVAAPVPKVKAEGLGEDALRVLNLLLPHLSVKTAAQVASDITGASRKGLYAAALEVAAK